MCIAFQREDLVSHQKKQSTCTFKKHSDKYPGVFIENLLLFCSNRKREVFAHVRRDNESIWGVSP